MFLNISFRAWQLFPGLKQWKQKVKAKSLLDLFLSRRMPRACAGKVGEVDVEAGEAEEVVERRNLTLSKSSAARVKLMDTSLVHGFGLVSSKQCNDMV